MNKDPDDRTIIGWVGCAVLASFAVLIVVLVVTLVTMAGGVSG